MDIGDNQNLSSGITGLFDAHRGELLRFLTARCGSRDTAEDFLQDLWIKASAQPAGPIANGRAYLFRMANNLMLDHVRSKHRAMARDRNWLEAGGSVTKSTEDRPDSAIPADEMITKQQEAEILRQAIDELPPGAARALTLYRFKEHSQAEIAEIMGISRSGVEKHLAVAMKHLRNSLKNCGYFGDVTSSVRDGKIPSMETRL